MILGIGTETAIFFYAVFTGISVWAVYKVITYLRKLIRHARLAENLEDIVFWLSASGYVFAKMYDTTYGEIRWFFLAGLTAGAAAGEVLFRFICKRKEKT